MLEIQLRKISLIELIWVLIFLDQNILPALDLSLKFVQLVYLCMGNIPDRT